MKYEWIRKAVRQVDLKAHMKAVVCDGPLNELDQRMELSIELFKTELIEKLIKAHQDEERKEMIE